MGAWEEMLAGVSEKIRLCELMPAAQAARAQEKLAMAARYAGRIDLADWLADRAKLLGDIDDQVDSREGSA